MPDGFDYSMLSGSVAGTTAQLVPLVALIAFPMLIALILLVLRDDKARTPVVWIGGIVTAALSIYVALSAFSSGPLTFRLSAAITAPVGYVAFAVDLILSIYIAVKAVRAKKWLALGLALVQFVAVIVLEFVFAHGIDFDNCLYIDNLSAIMALIIGIIGSGICIYAIGYMRDFQNHAEGEKDRRPVFFSLMFVFLGAMFALVFSNNLMWLFTAWEATTVCSFALIGYTRTGEAVDNSFRQICMNLLGGIAFALALMIISAQLGILELDLLIFSGTFETALLLPVALLCFAGITKAAQMPFHSWLLGAMVAPTPTSALLHSSTMVKAGVFLLIKLAPCLGFNAPGIMVMFVGGATFLICSCLAISQSNAKRVLAYSTIANLGLITACAGVGTPEAAWAGIFLIIFHAAAKSLLFCCVGTAEHHIGSRDIEDMDLLFKRMPRLTRFMLLGIMVMFIAPFGMLISKWAALQSFIDGGNLILVMLLVFGSAATFFFWAKWMGKLSANAGSVENIEGSVHRSEWTALVIMVVIAVGCSIFFPLISSFVVVPYLDGVPEWFGSRVSTSGALASDNLIITGIIALFVAAVFIGLPKKSKSKKATAYLAGLSVDNEARMFKNSLSEPQEATQSNWYLETMFGEARLDKVAVGVGAILCIAGIVGAFIQGGVL